MYRLRPAHQASWDTPYLCLFKLQCCAKKHKRPKCTLLRLYTLAFCLNRISYSLAADLVACKLANGDVFTHFGDQAGYKLLDSDGWVLHEGLF